MAILLLSENFDEVTAPNLPSTGWASFDPNLTTSQDYWFSIGNSLKMTNPGSAAADQGITSASDSYGGLAQVQASFLFPTTPVTEVAWSLCLLRPDTSNYYQLRVEPVGSANAGVTLLKTVAGTTSVIGSGFGATNITVSTTTWYTATLTISATAGIGNIQITVTRSSDQFFLGASSWQLAGVQHLFTDTSLSGSGQATIRADSIATTEPPIYADNFYFWNLASPRMKRKVPSRIAREPRAWMVW